MKIRRSVESTSHGKSLKEEGWLVTTDYAKLVKRFDRWCSLVTDTMRTSKIAESKLSYAKVTSRTYFRTHL